MAHRADAPCRTSSEPLDKGGLIHVVVSRRTIEGQDRGVLAPRHEHDLVAPVMLGYLPRARKAGGCQTATTVRLVGDDVLDEGIGPLTMREIGNDDDHARRDDRAVLFSDKDVVVLVSAYRTPETMERGVNRWHRILMELGVKQKETFQVVLTASRITIDAPSHDAIAYSLRPAIPSCERYPLG